MKRKFLFVLITACIFSVKLFCQLPTVYDLRALNLMTPVKDQGSCGACWAFATIASIESSWLKKGYGLFSLSEDNLIDCHGFDETPCAGGSYYMSNALLSRHSGPLLSATDPYTPTITNCPNNQPFPPTPQAYIEDMRFLPKNTPAVKQALYDNGAVATAMFFNPAHYSNSTYKYFDNILDATDSLYPHCVAIAGWNDTMTFPGAAGPGGWIIKDSYGTSWAHNGYFYVSYYDAGILSETAFFPVTYDKPATPVNGHIYYYDKFGWVDNFGFGSNTAHALVMYSLMPAGGMVCAQQVKRIGTYAVSENTQITIQIYRHFSGNNLSGFVASTTIQCDYPGFYSIPFELPSDTVNTTLYIKASFQTPVNQNAPIPVEKYEAFHTSGISLSQNACFVSPDGINWIPAGAGTNNAFDLCIKLYTEDAPLASIHSITDTVCQHDMLHLNDNTPFPKDSAAWYVDGVYHNSMPMIDIFFATPGLHTVSLIAYYGNNSDTAIKTIVVNPLPTPPTISQIVDTLFSTPALSYQWYDNNGPIPGAVEYFFVPLVTGQYYVEVTNLYNCRITSAPYNYIYTKSNSLIDNRFSVFPNPFNNVLNIYYSSDIEHPKIYVYNIIGKQIPLSIQYYDGHAIISSSQLKGIFVLNIILREESYWFKLVGE